MLLGHVLRPVRASATKANWIYLAIGAGLVSVLRPFGHADLVAVAEWMNSSIPVPRWLFGLCLTAGTAMGLIGIFASRTGERGGTDDPQHHKYVSDKLNGVHWRWGWISDSQSPLVDIETLVASCEACHTKLHEARFYAEGVQQIELQCGSCSKTRLRLPLGTRVFDVFLDEVKREIEWRAREREAS